VQFTPQTGQGSAFSEVGGGWETNTSNGYLTFSTSMDGSTLIERMRINNLGNVGIGEASPVNKLHLASSTDLGIILEKTTAGSASINVSGSAGSSRIAISGDGGSVGATERMSIIIEGANAGKVGIGATTPNEKLEVNGNIRVNNTINVAPNRDLIINASTGTGNVIIVI